MSGPVAGAAVEIPAWAWEREEIREALRARDAGAILRFAQQYGGASQSRIAAATGLLQGRVNEIVRGRRSVVRFDVFERIAQGLRMPDHARMLMGLAPRRLRSYGVRDLMDHPQVAAVALTKPEAAAEIREAAASADAVDVVGVRALGLVALGDSLLRGPLTRDGRTGSPPRMRLLLLHPESPAVARIAEEVGETPRFFASSLRFAEDMLAALADEGTIQLEVYRYRTAPVWRLVRLDGAAFVSVIGPPADPRGSLVYRLSATPPGSVLYGFDRWFEAMLGEAERVI
ncbi:helix-turn-helix domain-containing protein [Streptomyces sp. PA03-1a]|nr:helix-turn-helix domain-containing protein [Streptomyces sp. PA03-1a]MDX2811091.1 helix-turn-helix domain-containing protein [Streptomyces sp. PA03-5A]